MRIYEIDVGVNLIIDVACGCDTKWKQHRKEELGLPRGAIWETLSRQVKEFFLSTGDLMYGSS